MKRLVGGEFLLDVSSIELEETSTLTNITDKEIISQLTNLKKFISNPSMIKPIWVKLYDGKLVVARGSLSMVDVDEFELDIILNGYTLRIYVKFTQVLNEDEDPIDDWYIANNDAKYLFTTNNFVTFKVADVKNIDGEILSQLKCGDIIIKEDASGEHAYIVSYRGETGICLTYADASVIETQSYDLVDDEWVYNSEDKTENLLENVKPLYFHPIRFTLSASSGDNTFRVINGSFMILNNSSEPLNTFIKIRDYLYNHSDKIDILCNMDYFNAYGVYQGQILNISANTTYWELKYTTNGLTISTLQVAIGEVADIVDNVNKIN